MIFFIYSIIYSIRKCVEEPNYNKAEREFFHLRSRCGGPGVPLSGTVPNVSAEHDDANGPKVECGQKDTHTAARNEVKETEEEKLKE